MEADPDLRASLLARGAGSSVGAGGFEHGPAGRPGRGDIPAASWCGRGPAACRAGRRLGTALPLLGALEVRGPQEATELHEVAAEG